MQLFCAHLNLSKIHDFKSNKKFLLRVFFGKIKHFSNVPFTLLIKARHVDQVSFTDHAASVRLLIKLSPQQSLSPMTFTTLRLPKCTYLKWKWKLSNLVIWYHFGGIHKTYGQMRAGGVPKNPLTSKTDIGKRFYFFSDWNSQAQKVL